MVISLGRIRGTVVVALGRVRRTAGTTTATIRIRETTRRLRVRTLRNWWSRSSRHLWRGSRREVRVGVVIRVGEVIMATFVASVGSVEDGVMVPDFFGPDGVSLGVEYGGGGLACVTPSSPAGGFPGPVGEVDAFLSLGEFVFLAFGLAIEDAGVVVDAHCNCLLVESRGRMGIAIRHGNVHGEEHAVVEGGGVGVDVAGGAGFELQAADGRAADDG